MPKNSVSNRKPARLLRTRDVEGILGVSGNTVRKLCDEGYLRCHRLPGSTHRRFWVGDLVRFLRKHDLPIPDDLDAPERVKERDLAGASTELDYELISAGAWPSGKGRN